VSKGCFKCGRFHLSVRKESKEDEFVAAETDDQVTFRDNAVEESPHQTEHGIAEGMSVLVVDGLKALRVQEEEGKGALSGPFLSSLSRIPSKWRLLAAPPEGLCWPVPECAVSPRTWRPG
jgi:hypothetical protein